MSAKSAAPELYPGLDAELDAVYARNAGLDPDEAKLSATGLSTVVSKQLEPHPEKLPLPESIKDWAYPEINVTLSTWYQYESSLGVKAPFSIEDLESMHPNLNETIERLYDAKQTLSDRNHLTPEGTDVGRTMHLVLVPWQGIRNIRETFSASLKDLRATQNMAQEDYFDPNLRKAIENNDPVYRNPTIFTQLLTPEEYLDRKIAEDGPWGVMLMQTGMAPGIEKLKNQSPAQLTNNGTTPLWIEGIPVDSMGVFEWLALSLQQDPKGLSKIGRRKEGDRSWLLANRVLKGGAKHVPFTYCESKVTWRLSRMGTAKTNRYPRLAVA